MISKLPETEPPMIPMPRPASNTLSAFSSLILSNWSSFHVGTAGDFWIFFYGQNWKPITKIFFCYVYHNSMKLSICFITSTDQPLPSIRYACVSLHSHLYHSGIVCNREHSVGVRRRIRQSFPITLFLPPNCADKAGIIPLMVQMGM